MVMVKPEPPLAEPFVPSAQLLSKVVQQKDILRSFSARLLVSREKHFAAVVQRALDLDWADIVRKEDCSSSSQGVHMLVEEEDIHSHKQAVGFLSRTQMVHYSQKDSIQELVHSRSSVLSQKSTCLKKGPQKEGNGSLHTVLRSRRLCCLTSGIFHPRTFLELVSARKVSLPVQ